VAIETHQVTLYTADGLRLDGDLSTSDGARAAAVVCHPHPLYGGTRFDSVVDALVRTLPQVGVDVLRFDFRGVNDSEGTHGGGVDERLDVAAALDHLRSRTDLPLVLAGYSFGAAVVLDTVHPDVVGWLAVAPPLAMMPGPRAAAHDPRPKHLLVAGHDQFSPPEPTAAAVADWTATTSTVLPSADHFLAGHLGRVGAWATDAIAALLAVSG
jgi:uncharacterized protein